MKLVLLTSLLCVATAACEPLVVLDGSVSPDKRWAVAVARPEAGQDLPEDSAVYLVEAKSHKVIGPLEEVISDGGSWGKTLENVKAAWSSDGSFLIINFRDGRLIHFFQLYLVEKRRAVPVKLPEAQSHPKGKFLDGLPCTSNAGAQLRWDSTDTLVEYVYGYRPERGKDWPASSPAGFEGSVEIEYRLMKRRWKVTDVRVPKIRE